MDAIKVARLMYNSLLICFEAITDFKPCAKWALCEIYRENIEEKRREQERKKNKTFSVDNNVMRDS